MTSDKETAGLDRPHDHEEAARRLPPILHQIDAFDIQEETARLTCDAPAWFWTKPATTHPEYHHPISRQERGLWAHTLMLMPLVEKVGGAWVECGFITERELDCARAAALLHDMRKNGPDDTPTEYALNDHDLRMGTVIREESALPSLVADAVESHMSAWDDGPLPEGIVERLVAAADLMASTPTNKPAILGELPDELVGMGLTVVDV